MIFGDTIYAASTAAPAAQQQANPVIMWIWIIGMIAVYYFLVILPQNKKNKAHNNLLNSLEVGDEVVTASGIKGEVVSLGDEFIDVRIDKGVKITIKKGYIQSIYKKKATI